MVKRHDSKNPGLIQDIFVPLKVEKKIAFTSSYLLVQSRPYTERHCEPRRQHNDHTTEQRRFERKGEKMFH
jgi:hypothetical protein